MIPLAKTPRTQSALTRDELNRRAHDDNRAWLRDMDELLGDGWVPEVFPEDAGWPAGHGNMWEQAHEPC